MNGSELREDVRQLISSTVPSMDALELLMLLARHSERSWTVAEVTEALRPTVLSEAAVRESMTLFGAQGIVAESGGRFRLAPAGPRAEAALAGLVTAYNERPVTLIRTVYAIADAKKIQAFADAFKLKRDD